MLTRWHSAPISRIGVLGAMIGALVCAGCGSPASASSSAAPVANVFVEPPLVQIVNDTNTNFNANASLPNPSFSPQYSYRMNYGDGSPVDSPAFFANFVHVYRTPGTFLATLFITSPTGQVSTATVSAVVESLNGIWSTGTVLACGATSGPRSLNLVQSGTSLSGTYSGPNASNVPFTGTLSGIPAPGPGRYVTLTLSDGSLRLTSDTANAGVSWDGTSIGLYSTDPCLKGTMLVFGRQ